MDVYETKGDSLGRNSERREAEKAQECFIPCESTSFKIRHGGLEFCASVRHRKIHIYVYISAHTYILYLLYLYNDSC